MHAVKRRRWIALLVLCVGLAGVGRVVWSRYKIARVDAAIADLREVGCRAYPKTSNIFPKQWQGVITKYGGNIRWGDVRGTSIARVEVDRNMGVLAAAEILREANVTVDHFYFAQHDDYRGTQADIETLFDAASFRGLYYRREKLPQTSLPFLRQEGAVWVDVAQTDFSNTAITDLPRSTKYLNLMRTRVNDEGLAALSELKNLRSLNLRRTPVSREAVDRFKANNPKCSVIWTRLKRRQ